MDNSTDDQKAPGRAPAVGVTGTTRANPDAMQSAPLLEEDADERRMIDDACKALGWTPLHYIANSLYLERNLGTEGSSFRALKTIAYNEVRKAIAALPASDAGAGEPVDLNDPPTKWLVDSLRQLARDLLADPKTSWIGDRDPKQHICWTAANLLAHPPVRDREVLQQAKGALIKIRKCSIAGAEEGYGKPELWGEALFRSHADVATAIKSIDTVLSLPLQPSAGERPSLIESFARLQRRLISYCNHANAGHMPSDGREFARRIILGFQSAYEDAGVSPPVIEPETSAEYMAALSPVPDATVSDEDWESALRCAMSCLRDVDIKKPQLDNAMQHAFGLLSLRKSSSPQDAGRAAAIEEHRADDIRALGWSVAVHNDYRQNGMPHTFWLFTKGREAIKGEGRTDADALNEVRRSLSTKGGDGRG